MHIRTLVTVLQVVWYGLAFTFATIDNDRFEGDSCVLADGTNGTCSRDLECEYLKTIPQHSWIKCSFDKNVSIVCCRSPPKTRFDMKSRSEQMCDSFDSFNDAANHIYAGTEAGEDEFPYLGALAFTGGNELAFRCGANLISDQYMLTAAHCLTFERPAFVRLGVVDIVTKSKTDPPVDIGIEDIIIHPDYVPRPLANDIALIKLNRTVTEDFLKRICLYTNISDPSPDVKLSIAGWGSTESNDWEMSPVLLKANVTTYDREDCNKILIEDKTPRRKLLKLNTDQLCALGRNTTGHNTGDTCVGDSGGPLELAIGRRRWIVGLTSTGKICGTSYPGIYTRVSQFIGWIEKEVWPEN
ncbi:serine protease Hayan-like isoform X1 [Armigeres subalbatus]|uniref:serine protease Hayan-like isoform X1 n=1 Tax=Armigeres subalbatus TaxID=124917 RepID=UPI002ED3FB23